MTKLDINRYEPRFILMVDWGEPFTDSNGVKYESVEYFSTHPDLGVYQLSEPSDPEVEGKPKLLTVNGILKSISSYSDTTRVDGFGSAKSVDLVFADYAGTMYERMLLKPFYSKEIVCKLYLFMGSEFENGKNRIIRYLFDGQFQDPISYDIDTKELSISLVSVDRNKTVCYTPKIEDVNQSETCPVLYEILKKHLVSQPWPEVFGTVKNYPAVPLINNLVFTTKEDLERHTKENWDDPYELKLSDGGLNLDLTGMTIEMTIISKDPRYYNLTFPMTFTTEVEDIEDEDGITKPTSVHTVTFNASDIDPAPEDGDDIAVKGVVYGPEWELEFEALEKHSASEDYTVLKLVSWKEGAPVPNLERMYLGIGEEVVGCVKQEGVYLTCYGVVEGTTISWAGSTRVFPAVIPRDSRVIFLQQSVKEDDELDFGAILEREFIRPGVLSIIAGLGWPSGETEEDCDWLNDYLALQNTYVVDSKEDTEIVNVKVRIGEKLITLPTECWVAGWVPGKIAEEEEEVTEVQATATSKPSGWEVYYVKRNEKENVEWPRPDPKTEDLAFWSIQPWNDKSHGGCRYIKLNYLALTYLFPLFSGGFDQILVTCKSPVDDVESIISYLCETYGGFTCDGIVVQEDPKQLTFQSVFGSAASYVELEDSQDYDLTANFVLTTEEDLFDIVSEVAWQRCLGVREKIDVETEEFVLELVDLKVFDEDAATIFDSGNIDIAPVLLSFTPIGDIRTRLIAYEQTSNMLRPFTTWVKERNVDMFGNQEYEFNFYAWESETNTQEVLNWWSEKLCTPFLQIKLTSYLDNLDVNLFDEVTVRLPEIHFKMRGGQVGVIGGKPSTTGTFAAVVAPLSAFNPVEMPEFKGRVIERNVVADDGKIEYVIETRIRMDCLGKELKRDETLGLYYWEKSSGARQYVKIPF